MLYCNIKKDAQKFARRSRRKGLTTADIDHALKARSLEVELLFFF
jgi:histone H3/H4